MRVVEIAVEDLGNATAVLNVIEEKRRKKWL